MKIDREKFEEILGDDNDPGAPPLPEPAVEDLQYAIFQFSIILLRELKKEMLDPAARDSVATFLRTLAEQLENQHQGDTNHAGPA